MRRELFRLVLAVALLDAVFIAGYFRFDSSTSRGP